MTPNDHRLIEDYIPIEAISNEARREKSIRKGHISTLHLWWARRPLVAARAAVYGALVPAPTGKKAAKEAAGFVADLCTYPGPRDTIKQAQKHILQAHAERLTAEQGQLVTVEDIEAGRAPRPRVLDMFAGGGAIPLEALRLGCEAYALDLNPVAHLIQLCTLVYPQQFGRPDPAAVGCADDGTWAGLAAEVEHWGQWVLEKVKAEIGDLYPPIPDPAAGEPGSRGAGEQMEMFFPSAPPPLRSSAFLTPVAYLWTRTVRCKNPACGGTVPLARQTWLAKKKGRYIALRSDPLINAHKSPDKKTVHYRVVEATTEKGLGFNPAGGSRGGNVPCPFCGTVVDSEYVKSESLNGRLDTQFMAVICVRKNERGKVYIGANDLPSSLLPNDEIINARIDKLCTETGLRIPEELMDQNDPTTVAGRGFGFSKWYQLFTPRQLLLLLELSKQIQSAYTAMTSSSGYNLERAKAIVTYLAFVQDRIADWNSSFCSWSPESTGGAKIGHTFARQAIPMVWDFTESGVFSEATGSASLSLDWVIKGLKESIVGTLSAQVQRTSATSLPLDSESFDAVITDPPYYDNISYAVLSDFFYVWLKRAVGNLYPEHFASVLTPKKSEAIADNKRYGKKAKDFYEKMMLDAFSEAKRVLKPNAPLVVVYAHKTTLGWSTLVDALRQAGFTVTEAWPLDTEMGARMIALDSAALASSIFLVARRRESDTIGSYEHEVQPELHRIVRERLERLWAQGITGADLVIACVGAGLRAFTRFARVEYANGEPVPADSFLGEVEGAVLEALLEKLFGVTSAGVSSVDAATRFYVLWRYAYRQATIDAGEAIVFAYPQHVELDGPNGLSSGRNGLVEKSGGKYRLRDFTERGEAEDLGQTKAEGKAPLIDVLHRLLWLVEHEPAKITAYLDETRPDLERLRVVAQTLAGQTLAGNGNGGGRSLVVARGAEAAALRKLTTNWRTLIEAGRGPLV